MLNGRQADMESDMALARHVTFVHQFKKNPELDFEPFDPSFLKLYISQVRVCLRFFFSVHFVCGTSSILPPAPVSLLSMSRAVLSSPALFPRPSHELTYGTYALTAVSSCRPE